LLRFASTKQSTIGLSRKSHKSYGFVDLEDQVDLTEGGRVWDRGGLELF